MKVCVARPYMLLSIGPVRPAISSPLTHRLWHESSQPQPLTTIKSRCSLQTTRSLAREKGTRKYKCTTKRTKVESRARRKTRYGRILFLFLCFLYLFSSASDDVQGQSCRRL